MTVMVHGVTYRRIEYMWHKVQGDELVLVDLLLMPFLDRIAQLEYELSNATESASEAQAALTARGLD